MGYSRALGWLAAQALLVASGAALVAALERGYYATALVCALLAGWIGLAAADRLRAPSTPILRAPVARLGSARAVRTMQALLDQSPTPLATLDQAGVLRAVNRAARRLFRSDDRVPAPDPDLLQAIGSAEGGERRQVRLGEGPAARAYAVSVAEVSDGGAPLRLAALTDVQAELHQAEAEALRQLLQVLGHEIMNSLTPIASLAETAAALLATPDLHATGQAREAVETIGRRSEGLARFVQAYRTLARLPAPTLRPVVVGELVDDVARLVRTRWPEVRLTVVQPQAAVVRRLDPDLVSQALLNLLANAAEAAGAARDDPAVDLRLDAADDGLRLEIGDNGPGVSPEQAARLFQPFVTTKPAGMGVGLSLARQILRAHGGDVDLEAGGPGGAGARFVMRF